MIKIDVAKQNNFSLFLVKNIQWIIRKYIWICHYVLFVYHELKYFTFLLEANVRNKNQLTRNSNLWWKYENVRRPRITFFDSNVNCNIKLSSTWSFCLYLNLFYSTFKKRAIVLLLVSSIVMISTSQLLFVVRVSCGLWK